MLAKTGRFTGKPPAFHSCTGSREVEYITEGSLEVKPPSIWTDEKQRWSEEERRSKRESLRRKKIQVPEKESRETLVFQ
jgi:hypothetical protein